MLQVQVQVQVLCAGSPILVQATYAPRRVCACMLHVPIHGHASVRECDQEMAAYVSMG